MNTVDDWMRKLMNCLVCLALMALLFALPMTAIAEDIDFDSFIGYVECGDSLGVGVDKSGTLTIFNWDMYDTSAKSLYDIGYMDDVNQWEDWFDIDIVNVVFATKVDYIGAYFFANCDTLTSITLPDTLVEIGAGAFMGCENLTSITLPENLKSIPSYAFSGCTSLTDVNLPAGVTSLGNGAFNGCPVQWSVDRHSAQAQMLSKAGYTFVDPEYPEFSLKTDVYSNAKFVIVDCKDDVTSVTIPDDMVGIKDNAFSGCTALESITLHDNFEDIGTYAFKYCPATIYANLLTLTATRLPEGSFVVPEYPNLLFSVWCSSAPFNVSNASVTLIGIREHTDVLTVPDVVSTVRASGFADFTGKFCANMTGKAALALTKANLPFSPVECLDLTITVTGSGSTRTVAVTGCAESATEVVLPEGVTTIAASAFANCPNLKSITLPESLTSVNAKAFDGCTALRYAAVGGKAARVLGTKGYTTPDCPQLTLNTTYAGSEVGQCRGRNGNCGSRGRYLHCCLRLCRVRLPDQRYPSGRRDLHWQQCFQRLHRPDQRYPAGKPEKH